MITIRPLPDNSATDIIEIPTPDDKLIYSELDCATPKHDRIVIYAHGFRASMNDFQAIMARHYFAHQDYDFLRFNFYGSGHKNRKLHQCELTHHINDYQTVIDQIKDSYANIYVMAHSLGALTAMMANHAAVTTMSLWDATYPPGARLIDQVDSSKKFNDHLIMIKGRIDSFVLPEFVSQIDGISETDTNEMAQALTCPAQLITAGKSVYTKAHPQWFKHFNLSSSHALVEDADHGFGGNALFQTLSLTHDWFNQH